MDFEKELGLEPITKDVRHNGLKKDSYDESKATTVLKEAIDDFPGNPDNQRTPPLPEFDYLFTNWPDKNPSEKPFKIKPSNQLEKNKSSIPAKKLDVKKEDDQLSDEEKKIVARWKEMLALKLAKMGGTVHMETVANPSKEAFESSTRKLNKKHWSQWNKTEWKIAKRVTKNFETVTAPGEGEKKKGKIFSIKPLLALSQKINQESYNRSKSKALVEMKFLDFLFKKAMTANHPKPEKEEGANAIYTRINDIVSKTLKEFDLKAASPKKYDDPEVIGINYQLKIGKEPYAIHTYLLKGNKVFLFTLWDKEENRLLLTVSEGYLRQYYYLVGIGKERLRSWMEQQNGKSESGKNRR